jgi:DNA invertase Pin-like site-specific DNA recombinase
MPKAVAYLRVSTERQANEVHTSLADQDRAVRALALKLGASIERTFTDAGASGATADGRPAFLELLAWCDAHRRGTKDPGFVLVLNDSRFGRFPDPEEAGYWRHHLQRLGWTVRFAEGDDVVGDFRTVVRAIGSVQASEYRRNLVANTRRGMKGAATLGFWTREAPFGFRREVVYPEGSRRILEVGALKAPNEKVKLIPHPAEAAVVRWMFDVYASGAESLGSLVRVMERRFPDRRWSKTQIQHMMKNEAYRGAVVGGRRRSGESEVYGCENAHPAIVEARLWTAVQDRLGRNVAKGRAVRSPYLLTGLLHCSLCGEHYRGAGGGKSTSGKQQRFYMDRGGALRTCPGRMGTISRHIVDDAVVGTIAAALEKPNVRRTVERAIDRFLAGAGEQLGAEEVRLRAARAQAEQRIDRLTAAIADGALLGSEASPRLDAARAALADAEGGLQALRFAHSRVTAPYEAKDRLLAAVLDFPALAANTADPVRLRRLVEPWVGRALFDKHTRKLTLGIYPVPALLLVGRPAPTGRDQRLIIRQVSLLQRGYPHQLAAAARRRA